jgi:hypothetical protein
MNLIKKIGCLMRNRTKKEGFFLKLLYLIIENFTSLYCINLMHFIQILFLPIVQYPSTISRQKKRTTRMDQRLKKRWLNFHSKPSIYFAFGTAAHAGSSFKKWSHGSCSIHLLNCLLLYVLLSIRYSWPSIIMIWIKILRKF